MDWKRMAGRTLVGLENTLDRARHGLLRATIGDRPARVVPYRGWGSETEIHVLARILHGPAPGPASPEDRWWANLVNAWRRIESDEAPRARVRIAYRGHHVLARADVEGYVRVTLRRDDEDGAGVGYWDEAEIELLQPRGAGATAPIAIPRDPAFGVISDLDDTVVQTDVRDYIRMVAEVLFGNAHTRIPFAGVGAFYRALHAGRNPLFYVSSSPWNLYDVLTQFLELHHIPAGPMVLRDWGLSRGEFLPFGHHGHKRAAIDRILATYPGLPFLLIGDSGQEDPEIYRSVVHDHPGRIRGIYIRSVVTDPDRIGAIQALADELADHGSPLVLVDDTLQAARHAADRGWIDPDAIPAVAEDRRREGAEAGTDPATPTEDR